MGLFSSRRALNRRSIGEAVLTTDNPSGWVSLEPGRAYWITYECRDLGYGVEADYAEFIYRGLVADKHELDPVGGGEPIYLFTDEIKDVY